MMRRLPKMIQAGSNSAFQPTLMLPISRYVPSGAVIRSPSSTTLGLPTSSITTSPPQPSVSAVTRFTRATGALDDDGLPDAEVGEVEAGVDLGEGAVHASRHLVGDLVRQLEDGVVRAQVEILAEAALEVRPHLAGGEKVGLAHRARLGA